MSVTLKIENFGAANIKETTQLGSSSAASQAVATVLNSQNFVTDDFFIVGNLGAEQSELRKVSSVSGSNITATANFTYPHNKYVPVTKLLGDKIRVYRASNVDGSIPADTSFSLLATLDIDADQPDTLYVDSSGSDAYWYKFTYYNSVSSGETGKEESIAVRGGASGNYCSVEEIRGEAGLKNNRWISDSDVDTKRIEAQAEIDAALQGIYSVPFTPPINAQITNITKLLAAGFVLLKDYGPLNNGSSKDGQKKVDEARAILARIKTKELVLTDSDGGSLAIVGAAGFSGWPNNDTATTAAESGGAERMFRASDQY